MKKNLSLSVLTLIMASGLVAQNGVAPSSDVAIVSQQLQTGHQAIQSVRKNYDSGAYDAFLATLHADYQKMAESSKFSEFVKMREAPPVDEKLKVLAKQWEEIHKKLITERNVELKEASSKVDEALAQRIQSIITQTPSDQKEALQYITSLRFKTPEMAANIDEKKLIEIDLATEFKVVHLDAQYAEAPFADRLEKHVVINMDMIRQMLEASKSFKDSQIKGQVELAASGFDSWQERNWDLNLLNDIVKKPSNDNERIIAAIVTKYQTKKADLYQKEFIAKLQ